MSVIFKRNKGRKHDVAGIHSSVVGYVITNNIIPKYKKSSVFLVREQTVIFVSSLMSRSSRVYDLMLVSSGKAFLLPF